MPEKAFGQHSHLLDPETCAASAIEEKRRYNREYMRRWRADPGHIALERRKRRERYYATQKQQRVDSYNSSPQSNGRVARLCGFCWKRPALKNIPRLQVCESAPDGFIKIRVPYCGVC